MNDAFLKMVADIPAIGWDWHRETLLANSRSNVPFIGNSIREVKPMPSAVLVVSAGPSLHSLDMLQRIAATDLPIVATDGAYIKCLKAGITPSYVVTLDPHPTRIVRWFGDPEFWANSKDDDYFERQDLDESFRHNSKRENNRNIAIVNASMGDTSLVICCASPANVVERTDGFKRYWFAPLVDNPKAAGSLTREIATITGLPSLNTGGTVGTAAIMFAHQILKAPRIGVVGMDLGYAKDTPYERTQSWNMLKDRPNFEGYYPKVAHPVYGECYTDPTYAWYRQNLLALLKSAGRTLYNCTGGGALYGPHVECLSLEAFANG